MFTYDLTLRSKRIVAAHIKFVTLNVQEILFFFQKLTIQ